MATAMFVVLVSAFFLMVGRSTRTARTPLRRLGLHGVLPAVLQGVVTFHRLHQRHQERRSGARVVDGQ